VWRFVIPECGVRPPLRRWWRSRGGTAKRSVAWGKLEIEREKKDSQKSSPSFGAAKGKNAKGESKRSLVKGKPLRWAIGRRGRGKGHASGAD